MTITSVVFIYGKRYPRVPQDYTVEIRESSQEEKILMNENTRYCIDIPDREHNRFIKIFQTYDAAFTEFKTHKQFTESYRKLRSEINEFLDIDEIRERLNTDFSDAFELFKSGDCFSIDSKEKRAHILREHKRDEMASELINFTYEVRMEGEGVPLQLSNVPETVMIEELREIFHKKGNKIWIWHIPFEFKLPTKRIVDNIHHFAFPRNNSTIGIIKTHNIDTSRRFRSDDNSPIKSKFVETSFLYKEYTIANFNKSIMLYGDYRCVSFEPVLVVPASVIKEVMNEL